ncbi:hypothetical protein GMAR_ORF260 [Golden Marseillevirus]|uniref:hypothetical protein n=1 Tax=Golden Marseillevirus TaxID=1720526 RepID=UPI000877AEDD|nr:hypothetical protein GMAR_ORF260 [Golden Marseillevirus]ALX27634.1 hypothetical protein GMAR_ORF260 [Golden Marseillevirus]
MKSNVETALAYFAKMEVKREKSRVEAVVAEHFAKIGITREEYKLETWKGTEGCFIDTPCILHKISLTHPDFVPPDPVRWYQDKNYMLEWQECDHHDFVRYKPGCSEYEGGCFESMDKLLDCALKTSVFFKVLVPLYLKAKVREEKMKELETTNEKLQEAMEEAYAPGGTGYERAKQHFENFQAE